MSTNPARYIVRYNNGLQPIVSAGWGGNSVPIMIGESVHGKDRTSDSRNETSGAHKDRPASCRHAVVVFGNSMSAHSCRREHRWCSVLLLKEPLLLAPSVLMLGIVGVFMWRLTRHEQRGSTELRTFRWLLVMTCIVVLCSLLWLSIVTDIAWPLSLGSALTVVVILSAVHKAIDSNEWRSCGDG